MEQNVGPVSVQIRISVVGPQWVQTSVSGGADKGQNSAPYIHMAGIVPALRIQVGEPVLTTEGS